MSEAVSSPESQDEPIPNFKRPGDGENLIAGEIPDPLTIPSNPSTRLARDSSVKISIGIFLNAYGPKTPSISMKLNLQVDSGH